MSLFILTLSLLFAVSLLTFDCSHSFEKTKMPILKTSMAIIIVLCHLAPKVDISWIQPLRYWGAPCVSVFFFVSGYGLTISNKCNLRYYLRRSLKVLIPCLLVSIMYFFLVRMPQDNLGYSLSEMIKTGTSPQHHLWFVWALLIEYSLFFLSGGIKSKMMRLCTLFVSTIAAIVVLRTVGYDRCWYVSLLAFPMGALVALYSNQVHIILNRNRLSFCGFFCFSMLLAAIMYATKVEYLYCISHAFIALAVFSIIYHLPIDRLFLHQQKIYGLSYEIYLTQVVSMDFLRGVLYVKSDVYFVLLTIVLIILLSLALNVAQAKVSHIFPIMGNNGK